MKGIVLAGGSGTRLYPVTKVVSKQLIPIYDKPMIYYPISSLMLAGITELLIISTPSDLPRFKELLGDGSEWGIQFTYAEQPSPDGLAQALIIGEEFLDGQGCTLILGDNIFYGEGFPKIIEEACQITSGAKIFGYYVKDPEASGGIEFDKAGKAISLEEKPAKPKSHFAVPGIYVYDKYAPQYAKEQKPSLRGELEITDLNRRYLEEGSLQVEKLGRGIAWLDTGTHQSLLQASNFIRTIIERQGLQIGCLEEIAYRKGYIDKAKLLIHAKTYEKTAYGQFLYEVAEGL